MFLLEKLPREEAKATDEPMGVSAGHFIQYIFKDLCLGSAVLLNRTIAAKLQAMLKTPWIPPFTHGRKMSGHRSQWALQVR